MYIYVQTYAFILDYALYYTITYVTFCSQCICASANVEQELRELQAKVLVAAQDIVLAYGSHTPTLAVQDSTFNLQAGLPSLASVAELAKMLNFCTRRCFLDR